jgi:hypothetical protein
MTEGVVELSQPLTVVNDLPGQNAEAIDAGYGPLEDGSGPMRSAGEG